MVEPWSWAWIGEKLWQMPGGVGALIGALIGFGALIYATRRGYENLIKAQKHQADLAREAREAQSAEDRKMLAAGLRGELNAIVLIGKAHIEFLESSGPRVALAAVAAPVGRGLPKVAVDPTPIIECAFFKANAGRLDLLGADLAAGIILIYEVTTYWRRRAEGAEPFDAERFKDEISNVTRNIESVFPKIEDVARRLEAIEQGLPDPGKGTAVPRKYPRWLTRRSHRPVS